MRVTRGVKLSQAAHANELIHRDPVNTASRVMLRRYVLYVCRFEIIFAFAFQTSYIKTSVWVGIACSQRGVWVYPAVSRLGTACRQYGVTWVHPAVRAACGYLQQSGRRVGTSSSQGGVWVHPAVRAVCGYIQQSGRQIHEKFMTVLWLLSARVSWSTVSV